MIAIGGTVFRQVIIWNGFGQNQGQLFHRLKGHEGVIFSVDYNQHLNLICSTSDDRTARLWKVNKQFGWKNSTVFPLHVLKSEHSSRIFRCLILPNISTLVTGGEDSMGIFWNCENGKCLEKIKANDGSPIWSLVESKSSKNIFFGGGNGAIKSFSYKSLNHDFHSNLPNLVKLSLNPGDYPKIIQFNEKSHELVMVTQNGQVWTICSEKYEQKQLIAEDEEFENYALLTVNNEGVIFIATIKGLIKWLLPNDIKPTISYKMKTYRAFDGKIFAMTILKTRNRLLICGNEGKMMILSLTNESEMSIDCQLLLPPCKEQRWFSCASENEFYIIIGDRCGNIHMYDKRGQILQRKTLNFTLCVSFVKEF